MSEEVPLTALPKYTNAQLIGADFAAQFFSDTQAVELEMTVLDGMWRDIQALCAENDWSLEEGLRIVLANGLAYLQHRMQDDSIEAKRAILDLSGQYAVMKFRAFQFMQAAQTLDMKLNGTRGELELLRRANEDLRALAFEVGERT